MLRPSVTRSFMPLYQQRVDQQQFQNDPAQHQLAQELEPLFIWAQNPRATVPVGLYIWGPVGRGKTFLMDLLFEHLERKVLRRHFYRFMEQIHQRLTELQGKRDPLRQIALELSKLYRLICFDEFFLNDIADAMILGRLLETLFEQGTVLISTSNRPPEQLCKDPIFQDRMQPLINLLQQNMSVFHLDGSTDHRLRSLTFAPCFYPQDQQLQQRFQQLTAISPQTDEVEILGRRIPVRGVSGESIWFDFEHICQGARSQLDYIALSRRYKQVFISHIPPLGGQAGEQIKARGTEDGAIAVRAGERQVVLARMDDPARRFIALVDELYDRSVNLYLSLRVPLEKLYIEGSLEFEFARTYSRLTEMQSQEYQQRPHQP